MSAAWMKGLCWPCLGALALLGCSGDDASTPQGSAGQAGSNSSGGSGPGGSGGSGTGGAGGTAGSAGSSAGGSAGTSSGGSAGSAGNAGSSGSGGSAGSSGSGGSAGSSGSGGGTGATLSARYPGDVGIQNDPAVVFVEDFEEGSVAALLNRYEDSKNAGQMALVNDTPGASSGGASVRLRAGGNLGDATDFYKRFPTGYEQLYVRYYVKYQPGADYHHSGVWIGGYSPGQNYPSPKAGLKPNGDDRISVSFEPISGGQNHRMDFYNYWMTMHSGPNLYYGNTLIHRDAVRAKSGQWTCIEIMLRLNPNPASPAGGELQLWQDDAEVIHFTDNSPVGYWTWDKFCPSNADTPECVNYPPPSGTPLQPLDLRWRSSASLQLNYVWPQNYNTSTQPSDVYYDDMVVATQRVGCVVP